MKNTCIYSELLDSPIVKPNTNVKKDISNASIDIKFFIVIVKVKRKGNFTPNILNRQR